LLQAEAAEIEFAEGRFRCQAADAASISWRWRVLPSIRRTWLMG